jgi:hypothetical protein
MEEFDSVLEVAGRGPGCGIRLPFDPKAVLGGGRAPVVVTVDAHEPFHTTVMTYGGVAWIGLRKDQQAAFGVGVGDRVHVTVARDEAPREVDVPPELARELAGAPDAARAYADLSYTHRKEYARWVAEAKREPTRLSRAAKAVTMLREGTKTPG